MVVIGVLAVSSSMSYNQQSLIPLLTRLLPRAPHWLAGVRFTYAGTVISVNALGFPAFVEFFIRKAAHFTVFAVFALAVTRGLAARTRRGGWAAVVAVLAALLVAAGDEFHQSLTAGRSPLIQDVVLDTCGALVGAGLAFWWWRRARGRGEKR
nr:VanZ family protein [Lacticaseibacillus kribbianus]